MGERSITPSQLEEGLGQIDDPLTITEAEALSSADHSKDNSAVQSTSHSTDHSVSNSANHSRRQSGETRPPRERQRVRFGLEQDADSQGGSRSGSQSRSESRSGRHSCNGSDGGTSNAIDAANPRGQIQNRPSKLLPLPRDGASTNILAATTDITESPARSSLMSTRGEYSTTAEGLDGVDEEPSSEPEATVNNAELRAYTRARSRAEKLSRSLNPPRLSRSAPGSQLPSPEPSPPASPTMAPQTPTLPKDLTNLIPMEELNHRRKKYGIEDDTESEDENEQLQPKPKRIKRMATAAKRLIRSYTNGTEGLKRVDAVEPGLVSGQVTPVHERGDPEHYVPPPETYKGGILSALLNMNKTDRDSPAGVARPLSSLFRDSQTATATGTPLTTPGDSPAASPPSSGYATPKRRPPKWHEKSHSFGDQPTASLNSLVNTSNVLAGPAAAAGASASRPPLKRNKRSSGALDALKGFTRKKEKEDNLTIRFHIEDVLARQQFMIHCCQALMKYGAPTHRLEEYMKSLARVLQIKGQFLYIPGCMLIAFDDPVTHTTEMKIVREAQGVNLGKLRDLHDIYKAVTHDKLGVKEASEMLNELWKKKAQFHPWVCVVLYGCASACVGPFAFGARLLDMPIAFVLGCILGFMQLILAPRSELYSNIFEITAATVTSFLARAFGSIRGGELFCFSALAQSSIALILPGYMVLSAALELQSRNMVAGSVRMVYAIIYSLFLGFGITIGTAFYGGIDSNATSDTTCRSDPIQGHLKFIFVPLFTMCLVLINQGKWRQAPTMLVISFAGYIVNYFSAIRFASNAQVANTLGALAIGILGNLYSRFFQGVSAAALLPAIFVQVPSGLAATGSLISGISTADQILSNSTASSSNGVSLNDNGIVFNVGYSMIQIAVGLTVGLFFSSLLVYPLGKRRSGLFSF